MIYSNVLLIEDDEDDQEIFLTVMEEISATANCTAESSAVMALQKLENQEINPDVIFLDLNMPIMDGRQFLAAIKGNEALRNIPVIILSTSSNPDTIRVTRSLGAENFITKPSSFTALKNMLHAILG